MSNDRKLLELAAKAAGYEIEESEVGGEIKLYRIGELLQWNPLTDDGDALRLAITLDMHIEKYDDNVEVLWYVSNVHGERNGSSLETFKSLDKFAATRRAIVRAAAEIGRAKGDQ